MNTFNIFYKRSQIPNQVFPNSKLPKHFVRLLVLVVLTWNTQVFATVSLGSSLPGVAVQNSTELLIALPIKNSGNTDAVKVEVREIELHEGHLDMPVHLPELLGTIGPDENAVLNLSFAVRKLDPTKTYKVTIEGRYQTVNFHHEKDRGHHGSKKIRMMIMTMNSTNSKL